MTQRVFGPDQRDGKWYFYAYVDGQQAEWGPYSSEEFARGAADAIERRLNGGPVLRDRPKRSEEDSAS
ncbi:MAG: hypothetical protein ACTHLT_06180 [Devosia sp.]